MNTYKLVVQTIQNGKITGNASLSVGANSTMEARQKFMASHPPTATKKYKIVEIFRKLTAKRLFRSGTDAASSRAAAMFLQRKNSRPEVYADVHFWTGYLQKADGKNRYTACCHGRW